MNPPPREGGLRFMNRPPLWFERKFEFTFPAEQCPNLCARLRGTPARLEELVGGVSHDVLVRKPQEKTAPGEKKKALENEKWSAQEHAGHLLDLEALWMARLDDYFAGATELTLADLSNRKTFEAQHNQRPIDAIVARFRSARSLLVGKVENMDHAVAARSIVHPRLKIPMRLVDHLYFVAEHDDHHLAHIFELVNQVSIN
jgi:uncharacterized damage-inducible protein DinB